MASQVLPIRIGAVSQPCTGRECWRRWLSLTQQSMTIFVTSTGLFLIDLHKKSGHMDLKIGAPGHKMMPLRQGMYLTRTEVVRSTQ